MNARLLITTLLVICSLGASAQYAPDNHPMLSPAPIPAAKQHQLLLHRAGTNVVTTNKTERTTSSGPVFDTTQWSHWVDSTWGNGITDSYKIAVLDTFWKVVDSAYPCFIHLPDYNWDSVVNAMRTEIGGGISKGRFAGIINQLSLMINDAHSCFYDDTVNYPYSLYQKLPLFRGESGVIGACVTTLDDTLAMVYDAMPFQPFGLQPGDVILGYNGMPWHKLVQTVLRYRLPNSIDAGSSDSALMHRYIQAAGENWYLFDTINIQKCDGSIVNLPTSLMDGVYTYDFCTEQLPVEGVKKVSSLGYYYYDSSISYGVMSGTQIGYVYMYDCEDLGDKLYNAVKALVEDSMITGLILDIRTNFGGGFNAYTKTFNYLNNGDVSWVGYGERSDPHNRTAMYIDGPTSWYNVTDDDPNHFDHRVAVLTGPNAFSAGDFLPILFRKDPYVKTFGKSTAGAYGSRLPLNLPDTSGYIASMQRANFFLATDPTNYISHTCLPVDFPMWLNRESVCSKNDNIVDSAVKWIMGTEAVTNVVSANPTVDVYPNPATSYLNIGLTTPISGPVTITLHNIIGNEVAVQTTTAVHGYNTVRMDISNSHIPSGNYYVSVSTPDGENIIRKVTIIH